MFRNFKCIASNGERCLWQYEIRTPSCEWKVRYRGGVHQNLTDENRSKAVNEPQFMTEVEGRAWLFAE